jgi:diacylglycerol O-acyltransferase
VNRPHVRSRIERVSTNDMTTLATDHGPVPMNIGAVLVVQDGGALEFSAVRAILESRLPRVPRMRQRLVSTPFGCGRPLWVDDPSFDLDHHLAEIALPEASGATPRHCADCDDRLLQAAADLVCTRLSRRRPLWTARWLTGPADDRAALVLVMHHAMTDGVGGLAVLAALGDDGIDHATDTFPEPRPSLCRVAAEAWQARVSALMGIPGRVRASLLGLRELGLGTHAPSLATRISLNRPTGPGRRLTTVEVPLAAMAQVAHSRGCTINDILLTAVTGALTGVLGQRGERPSQLVVSVPISTRHGTTADVLGNETGVVPLRIPMLPDQQERLGCVAAVAHARTPGMRGASAGPMGLVFRALGAMGLFQRFIDHQRLVHTFVTNVRGPSGCVLFAGRRIQAVIPLAVTPGNVGVCFDALSYNGRLVVTVVADPEILPEQDLLTGLLADELAQLLACRQPLDTASARGESSIATP